MKKDLHEREEELTGRWDEARDGVKKDLHGRKETRAASRGRMQETGRKSMRERSGR